MEFKQAAVLARQCMERLRPYCEKGPMLAGSVRRLKPQVGDIELVAIPALEPIPDLFGAPRYSHAVYDAAARLGRVEKGGTRQIVVVLPEGIKLDFYLVLPPAQFGVIYTIRTGPRDFSKWVVTKRQKGGALPSYAKVRDGGVYVSDELIPMPEEKDFFDFLDLGWVEPKFRKAGWGKWS